MKFIALFAILLCAVPVLAAPWRVGVATTVITPERPVPLSGYGAREKPFERVDIDIFAKALAFEDGSGQRGVLITADLEGFHAVFLEEPCRRIMEKTGLTRGQIMLNASHNHTGPLLSLDPDPGGNLTYGAFTEEMKAEDAVAYTRGVQDKVVALAVAALEDLAPAELAWGSDTVGFVMNRRVVTPEGRVRMWANPDGPVDRRAPVLRVASPEGSMRALLVGCACHNTGLTPENNIISGDYAGYAQAYLEERMPDCTVLFMNGCGADANPQPRGDVATVRQHGQDLGEAALRALEKGLRPVDGPLRYAYAMADLPLKRLDRAGLAPFLAQATAENGTAAQMLKVINAGGALPDHYAAPIAVWAFGDDLTLVGLPGEVVSEYALNLYRDLPEEPLWVAGYTNDYFAYVPTAQIIREGGHEAMGVFTYLYGRELGNVAGFFEENVERVVLETAKRLIAEVSGRRGLDG